MSERTFTEIYNQVYSIGMVFIPEWQPDPEEKVNQLDMVDRCAFRILRNFTDRSGFRQEWQQVDSSIRDEVFNEIRKEIKELYDLEEKKMRQISLNNEEIAIIKKGLILYKQVVLQEKSEIAQSSQAFNIASKLIDELLTIVETLEKKLCNDYQTYTNY